MNSLAETNDRRKWIFLGLIFIFNLITILDRMNLSVVAPTLMKHFGFGPVQMGLAMSAFFWPYTLFQIPAGCFLDRIGLRKGLGITFVSWGLITFFTGWINGLIMLIVMRILLGIGEAPIYPGNVKFVNKWFNQDQRAFSFGIISAAVNIGLAAATWFIAVLVTSFGWKIMFFVTGIISIVFVPLWYGIYRDKTEGTADIKTETKQVGLLQMLKHRSIVGLTIGYFGTNYSLFFFLTWLPTYFVNQWHMSLMKSGAFTALVFLTGALGKPSIGWLCDALIKGGMSPTKARKIFLVSLNLVAACVAFAAFVPNPIYAVILFGIAEVTGQAGSALCGAVAADIAPKSSAGQVAGIMNMAAGLGGVVAPALTGILLAAAAGSYYFPLMCAGGFMVVSALAFAFILGKVEPLDVEEPRISRAV